MPLNRFFFFTLFFALLVALPIRVTGDCGFRPELYDYQFLNPAIASYDHNLSPLFVSFGDLYKDRFEEPAVVQQKDNLQEWYERYCEGVLLAHLKQIIYGRSENALNTLQQLMRRKDSKLADLSPSLRSNSFTLHLFKNGCTEVVDYLIFAKKCEPLVDAPKNTFAAPKPVGNARQELIAEGLELFKRVASHYIRLRYAYQLIRLAHYDEKYEQTIELYDFLLPKVSADPSLIYHWINGHRAGALLKLGERVEANYLYSRIFAECPSKRASAYLSFSVASDQEWEALLLRCENDRERANLHVLRAQNEKARLVEEMEEIYRLDPKNKALEVLLVSEIQRLETDFLGADFNPRKATNRSYGIPRKKARENLIALTNFSIKATNENRIARPELWQLATGYLHLLSGDYFYAKRYFGQLEDKVTNDTIEKQLTIFDQVLDVLLLESLPDSTEKAYFTILADEKLRKDYPDLRKLINDKFRDVYLANGRRGKANLMSYGLDDFRYNPDISLINELLGMTIDTSRNNFDRRLLLERGGPEAVNDLIDMQATYYLQRGQLSAAYRVFQKMPEEDWDNYGDYKPFVPFFNDRVNVRLSDTIRSYNKGQLMARMLELEEEAEMTTDPNEAARKLFAVGLGYYNMSYFGYNWEAADYFRSGTSAARAAKGQSKDFVFSTLESKFGNFENMSMERALYYFERARMRAFDPEAAARATFWAAKAERNDNYANGRPRTFGYFNILSENYQSTNFYRKAINECRTFAWYSGN